MEVSLYDSLSFLLCTYSYGNLNGVFVLVDLNQLIFFLLFPFAPSFQLRTFLVVMIDTPLILGVGMGTVLTIPCGRTTLRWYSKIVHLTFN